ncbi:hypothetical protein [Streptomyces sp. NRRL WC-3742]|uniref:hypothetical protein n=1 Tax=Streptomyces sp. NRRL WC-3742 TaxID=1463934 RepID=UPI0004C84A5D|nr:hypothetical protein [Streptomyces sp. NRRL WC-3742]
MTAPDFRITVYLRATPERVWHALTNADEAERADVEHGWSAVLSNLKTYLETGHPLPQQPWLMP